jgi:Family of unknown function (DUF5684)
VGVLLASSGGGFVAIIYIAVIVLVFAALWHIVAKAGRPGWEGIIPIYNYYVILKIVGRPGWWLILYFIPFVNIIIGIIVLYDLCKSYGKSGAWVLGFIFLPFVFFPMLGFGEAQYVGPAAQNPHAM